MKPTVLLFFVTAVLLTSCGSNNSSDVESKDETSTTNTADIPAMTNKKYPLKSGTVHFESHMQTGSLEMIQKSIVYFDDYGIKERKDTYDEDGVLKESFFSDGKTLYTLIHKNKSAYKAGNAYRGTELKFDWDEISSEDKSSGKAKKGSNEDILGKDCEVYFYDGNKFAGWKNICLLTEVQGSGVTNKTIATEIKEGPVSADLFAVPADYTVNN